MKGLLKNLGLILILIGAIILIAWLPISSSTKNLPSIKIKIERKEEKGIS